MFFKPVAFISLMLLTFICPANAYLKISGVYPHLAAFGPANTNTGCFGGKDETGIGAVVPWAGKLWFLTYSSHCLTGSADKLYTVDPAFNLAIRPESIGGTPANRLIHRETNQLFIGPYVIDSNGTVRTIPYSVMPGRHTATARHLSDPANKVYYVTMEGSIYEVNAKTLNTNRLFYKPVPGWHGKGAYTAQGRLVIANNGEEFAGTYDSLLVGGFAKNAEEMGVLAEWNATTWNIIQRRQFTDVTGPGGIRGASSDSEPIWTMGWDKRSVTLGLLDHGAWSFYRLPKASHAYEHRGGWYTEWPRIREVTNGKFLMDMFGMFYDFPPTFDATRTGGISPVSSHLRYVPDFCAWNGGLVLATDETSAFNDSPQAGRSGSNLWFGTWNDLATFGPKNGWGGPWLDDTIKANTPSAPYLTNGFDKKVLHLIHNSASTVTFTLETDANGNGSWQTYQTVSVGAGQYRYFIFPAAFTAQWIRLRSDRDCIATAYFHYGTPGHNPASSHSLFAGLADITDTGKVIAGLVRPPHDINSLQFLALTAPDGSLKETYFEVNQQMNYAVPSSSRASEVRTICSRTKDFSVDDASVIVTEGTKRFRLPMGNSRYSQTDVTNWWPRGKRQVESERHYWNIHGSFYEVPLEGGLEKLRPICTHNKQIIDFCSWSGLLVLSGVRASAVSDGNTFMSNDKKAGLWFGSVDDLWKLGQPGGIGGPWKNTTVTANTVSDPYLMTGYDKKTVTLSHTGTGSVDFTIEVNFDHVHWGAYNTFTVAAGQTFTHEFPDGYSAHWVRLKTDKNAVATAQFLYDTTIGQNVRTIMQNRPAMSVPAIIGTSVDPVSGAVRVRYTIPEKCRVVIDLFSAKGQKIRTLHNSQMTPGTHALQWRSTDQSTGSVGSGMYLCRIQALGFTKTVPIMLVP